MGSEFSKDIPENRKNEKMPQSNQYWPIFLCIPVSKSVSPEFCRSCKVIFCSFFADEDGWEAEKS